MRQLHHRLLSSDFRLALRRLQLESITLGGRRRGISAMMRVRNEEQFLVPSVESILPFVREVVIVDNASTDATPGLAARLAAKYPGVVRLHHYPHAIAKVGEENRLLASTPEGRASPRLLANYYNWCLARCTQPYVLKWDGDMIAAPALAGVMAEFRRSRAHFITFIGANLHPDRRHLINAREGDTAQIQAGMWAETTVTNWVGAYTDDERRLFPRLGASYQNAYWWCESLFSPFLSVPGGTLTPTACTYLHMKYCKRDPFANFSSGFEDLIKAGIHPGPTLPEALRPSLELAFASDAHS